MDTDKMARKIKEAKELAPADIKLILLGDSAVGKSKLVERFLFVRACNTFSLYVPFIFLERFLALYF